MRLNWFISGLVGLTIWSAANAEPPHQDENGNFHVPAVDLPPSSLLSHESRAVLELEQQEAAAQSKEPSCLDASKSVAEQALAFRRCQTDRYLASPEYTRLIKLFPVDLTAKTIGGVYAEVFTPKGGVSPENRHRVLINLHGGGFLIGARTFSKTESLPIAAIGRIEVISVDYRQGPENKFPAASDDVEAVYRELLKSYKPTEIGVYGCSAGGLLVAESVARFIHDDLPVPGAIGMLCSGAAYYEDGDSGQAWIGVPAWKPQDNPYLSEVDPTNPLAYPIQSNEIMSKYPPSLLISGTRDFALSSVVNTHSRLVADSVDAELHVWDGLGHGFFYDPRLPESRQAYDVIVRFFDQHLAR